MKEYLAIKENIFYAAHNSISNWDTFNWHNVKGRIVTGQTNSSQALCIDVWGTIKTSKDKNYIISKLFGVTGNDDFEILFEYEDRKILNEKKASQIDVLIRSPRTGFVVESKFTEAFGHCSQPNGSSKTGLAQCNGNYEHQVNYKNAIEAKCALSGKGIQYWQTIPEVFEYSSEDIHKPCPFKDGAFQLMRNMVFARRQDPPYSFVIAYCGDSAISSVADAMPNLGKTYPALNRVKLPYKVISYEKIIDLAITVLNGNEQQKFIQLQSWYEAKKSRVKNGS